MSQANFAHLSGAARIQRELRHLQKVVNQGQFEQVSDLQLVDENLFKWRFKVKGFDDEHPAGKHLNQDLQELFALTGQDYLLMEIRFPPGDSYGLQPFFLRVVAPRCCWYTGHVTAGGSICIQALVNTGGEGGWKPAYTVESILRLVLANMLDTEVVEIRTPTGPGGITGPLRIDLNRRWHRLPPNSEYSAQEAQAAFDRTVRNHGWRAPSSPINLLAKAGLGSGAASASATATNVGTPAPAAALLASLEAAAASIAGATLTTTIANSTTAAAAANPATVHESTVGPAAAAVGMAPLAAPPTTAIAAPAVAATAAMVAKEPVHQGLGSHTNSRLTVPCLTATVLSPASAEGLPHCNHAVSLLQAAVAVSPDSASKRDAVVSTSPTRYGPGTLALPHFTRPFSPSTAKLTGCSKSKPQSIQADRVSTVHDPLASESERLAVVEQLASLGADRQTIIQLLDTGIDQKELLKMALRNRRPSGTARPISPITAAVGGSPAPNASPTANAYAPAALAAMPAAAAACKAQSALLRAAIGPAPATAAALVMPAGSPVTVAVPVPGSTYAPALATSSAPNVSAPLQLETVADLRAAVCLLQPVQASTQSQVAAGLAQAVAAGQLAAVAASTMAAAVAMPPEILALQPASTVLERGSSAGPPCVPVIPAPAEAAACSPTITKAQLLATARSWKVHASPVNASFVPSADPLPATKGTHTASDALAASTDAFKQSGDTLQLAAAVTALANGRSTASDELLVKASWNVFASAAGDNIQSDLVTAALLPLPGTHPSLMSAAAPGTINANSSAADAVVVCKHAGINAPATALTAPGLESNPIAEAAIAAVLATDTAAPSSSVDHATGVPIPSADNASPGSSRRIKRTRLEAMEGASHICAAADMTTSRTMLTKRVRFEDKQPGDIDHAAAAIDHASAHAPGQQPDFATASAAGATNIIICNSLKPSTMAVAMDGDTTACAPHGIRGGNDADSSDDRAAATLALIAAAKLPTIGNENYIRSGNSVHSIEGNGPRAGNLLATGVASAPAETGLKAYRKDLRKLMKDSNCIDLTSDSDEPAPYAADMEGSDGDDSLSLQLEAAAHEVDSSSRQVAQDIRATQAAGGTDKELAEMRAKLEALEAQKTALEASIQVERHLRQAAEAEAAAKASPVPVVHQDGAILAPTPAHWDGKAKVEGGVSLVTLPLPDSQGIAAPRGPPPDPRLVSELVMNGIDLEDARAALRHCGNKMAAAAVFAAEATTNGGAAAEVSRLHRQEQGATQAAPLPDLQDEVNRILSRWRDSGLPVSAITRVERVQNLRLWTKFTIRRSEVLEVCEGPWRLNERFLFHGTSRSAMSTICRQGFDSRVSKETSILGCGVYFATSARYSHGYSKMRDPKPFLHGGGGGGGGGDGGGGRRAGADDSRSSTARPPGGPASNGWQGAATTGPSGVQQLVNALHAATAPFPQLGSTYGLAVPPPPLQAAHPARHADLAAMIRLRKRAVEAANAETALKHVRTDAGANPRQHNGAQDGRPAAAHFGRDRPRERPTLASAVAARKLAVLTQDSANVSKQHQHPTLRGSSDPKGQHASGRQREDAVAFPDTQTDQVKVDNTKDKAAGNRSQTTQGLHTQPAAIAPSRPSVPQHHPTRTQSKQPIHAHQFPNGSSAPDTAGRLLLQRQDSDDQPQAATGSPPPPASPQELAAHALRMLHSRGKDAQGLHKATADQPQAGPSALPQAHAAAKRRDCGDAPQAAVGIPPLPLPQFEQPRQPAQPSPWLTAPATMAYMPNLQHQAQHMTGFLSPAGGPGLPMPHMQLFSTLAQPQLGLQLQPAPYQLPQPHMQMLTPFPVPPGLPWLQPPHMVPAPFQAGSDKQMLNALVKSLRGEMPSASRQQHDTAVAAAQRATSPVSKSEARGTHVMLLCRVVLGRVVKGQQGLRRPPDGADSTTAFTRSSLDSEKHDVYAVYDNAQAYPEYVIHYDEAKVMDALKRV